MSLTASESRLVETALDAIERVPADDASAIEYAAERLLYRVLDAEDVRIMLDAIRRRLPFDVREALA